jgi:hypothetical protein
VLITVKYTVKYLTHLELKWEGRVVYTLTRPESHPQKTNQCPVPQVQVNQGGKVNDVLLKQLCITMPELLPSNFISCLRFLSQVNKEKVSGNLDCCSYECLL